MFIKLEKGPELKRKMKQWRILSNTLERAQKTNDFSRIDELLKLQREDQAEYNNYMDSLPQKFNSSYTKIQYVKDQMNIRKFYTKWQREDFYDSKGSIRRCKQFEKREGLIPFMEIEQKEKKSKEMERLNLLGSSRS